MERNDAVFKAKYIERRKERLLKRYAEVRDLKFSIGAHWAIILIALLVSYDFGAKQPVYGAWIFIAAALVLQAYQYMLLRRVSRELSDKQELSRLTRALGIPLILLTLVGDLFCAIAGFAIMRDKQPLEEKLMAYGVMVNVLIFYVSAVNIFKPYVANTFMLGMSLLIAHTVLSVAMLIYLAARKKDKKLGVIDLILAVLMLLAVGIGNIFSGLAGLVIISKYRSQRENSQSEWIDVLRRLFRSNLSVLGMFFVVFMITLSVFSNLTFDRELAELNDYANIFREPSLVYPFGTDDYGRCVFTRIVMGARISLIVGFTATMLPIIAGGLLGAASGYFGGRFDNVVMRLLDVLYAVPGILLAIAIVAAFGANTMNLILALSLGSIPGYARTVRASVMSLSNSEFVEAAKACGARDHVIILKHIVPNSLAPVIVQATLGIGGAVLSTSSLSYLGLGIEPHIPEWGNILKTGSNYLETKPFLAIYPGLAIILIVLAFNFFGDGLRDALDPKLK